MSELEVNSAQNRAVKLELQYLPCLEYFTCILQHEQVLIDIEERYVKQTFRNRCSVLTTNKIDVLTVPVKSYEAASPTKDILIDYNQEWIRRHLGCLKAAYGKSPFYEFYAPELIDTYYKKPKFLVDLNDDLLTICLRWVGVKKEKRYILSGERDEDNGILNAISLINNRKQQNAFTYYKPVPYYQTFGNGFVGNLSIIDLIFNMGPEAKSVLLRSCASR